MDAIFLRAESDHELDDKVFLGLSKCEFRAASVLYRSGTSVQVQSEDLVLYANRGETQSETPSPTVSVYARCSRGQRRRQWLIRICVKSRPVSLGVRVSSLAFHIWLSHGRLNDSRLSRRQISHVQVSADGRRGTSVGACVSVHAPLTPQTMPPRPHSQSNGAPSQTPSSLKPRLPRPSGTRGTPSSVLGWTSILPPMLLKTEPPTDATPCLIIY